MLLLSKAHDNYGNKKKLASTAQRVLCRASFVVGCGFHKKKIKMVIGYFENIYG